MVALVDLEDIIVVMGREPASAEEAAQWQFYIDTVSSFINGYVSVSFELKTDDVVRYQADYYGMIDLGGDPISSVDSVKNARTQVETYWDWDMMSTIGRLDPHEVVDVTYTHGYASVPDDISKMATQAVVGVLGHGATGPITSFTVGDVTESYAVPQDSAEAYVVFLSKQVLDRYSDMYGSWRLGHNQFPGVTTQFPSL